MSDLRIIVGDAIDGLRSLPDGIADCCVTSPPYWGLRDYGSEGQIGLESTPTEYVEKIVAVFREVRRVLRDDGTLWLNIGDSYAANIKGTGGQNPKLQGGKRTVIQGQNFGAKRFDLVQSGLKPKDLVGIPWLVAFALRADGWFLRSDIIWHKPNPMPESVTDRPTKSHEYIFLLAKSERYYFDNLSLVEPAKYPEGPRNKKPHSKVNADGSVALRTRVNLHTIGPRSTRNKRTVWTVTTKPFKGAHFAKYPPELIEPCILAGSRPGGLVLDPFFGAGTTGLVALQHGRSCVGIEINEDYARMATERVRGPMFSNGVMMKVGG